MRGPFGILLLGGGIILLIGLFTGKITFSGGAPASTNLSPADAKIAQKGAGAINPTNGKCPAGYSLLGGQCFPQSVLGQI